MHILPCKTTQRAVKHLPTPRAIAILVLGLSFGSFLESCLCDGRPRKAHFLAGLG
jgi:hypothetical protein